MLKFVFIIFSFIPNAMAETLTIEQLDKLTSVNIEPVEKNGKPILADYIGYRGDCTSARCRNLYPGDDWNRETKAIIDAALRNGTRFASQSAFNLCQTLGFKSIANYELQLTTGDYNQKDVVAYQPASTGLVALDTTHQATSMLMRDIGDYAPQHALAYYAFYSFKKVECRR